MNLEFPISGTRRHHKNVSLYRSIFVSKKLNQGTSLNFLLIDETYFEITFQSLTSETPEKSGKIEEKKSKNLKKLRRLSQKNLTKDQWVLCDSVQNDKKNRKKCLNLILYSGSNENSKKTENFRKQQKTYKKYTHRFIRDILKIHYRNTTVASRKAKFRFNLDNNKEQYTVSIEILPFYNLLKKKISEGRKDFYSQKHFKFGFHK
ncbi:hypothetical protein BpHYR1_051143 [Brachionus plicatilis]|uniref:Uncharacterized protein n=1 Tax=Brachionus plicatilis TaxID=10195 RepID=A0A3M7QC54_BRAPC|nr:hypothetical protein BpHYR1_051143 [Brachionus plicatilis]